MLEDNDPIRPIIAKNGAKLKRRMSKTDVRPLKMIPMKKSLH